MPSPLATRYDPIIATAGEKQRKETKNVPQRTNPSAKRTNPAADRFLGRICFWPAATQPLRRPSKKLARPANWFDFLHSPY
jgi:hypothetical protein